ncbi:MULTISPECIES: PH domain-containing protein [Sphingobacterium]|uniref:CRISPR/Cas system CSM-associated protein Csm2 small subunit n=1 Tax=Sphingobacterium zeae TaxID=1776859 RepID=A0ABU0UB10_9SPHI|nr:MULTISPECIES: PH domain-containing protein [Sphingobacterium]MDQ1152028.1 CRISPR/Cas system CSM-associated protein Csm2 small subunit [Sphingobacterium zeae]
MNMEQFAQDGQDIKIIEKLVSKVQDMLTPGERIDYIAVQKKPAVTILPDSITISNKRIFMCEFTKLGLATDFEIFGWQDIKDIAFKEEIFGSKVTVIPFTGENLSIDYIPKVQARKLYQYIKAALENYKKAELAAEKEKIVIASTVAKEGIIERPESNAAGQPAVTAPAQSAPQYYGAGQPTPQAPVQTQQPIASTPTIPTVSAAAISPAAAKEEEEDEITLKLKKLKTLFDKQLITQEEYESKKREVLSSL